MAAKPKGKEKPPRYQVQVELRKNETSEDAIARKLLRPEVKAAAAIQRFEAHNHEINAVIRELDVQIQAVNRGDMSRLEAMLTAQAYTLDDLICCMARLAYPNLNNPEVADCYLRLMLKAQSQCRTTVETIAEMKNPRPVAFVKQANIAHGPQQVNNGPPSRTEEKEIEQNRLSEANNELLPNSIAPPATSYANSELETLGEVNRATNTSR